MTERYSYAELKHAQRRCAEKAVEKMMEDCGGISTAQTEVLQAHANDLCASIFTAVIRQYNPHTTEDMEPVDEELRKQVEELEQQVKQREAKVKELRDRVPKLVAAKTRAQMENARKRSAEGHVT
ncbi:TPA: hypothetical protein N0F65_002695 [Lagenidium giganteum]|uniref:Uncharacterized protein n=1 Tax=Lagenidium giganteum TaxID=4803 RepID=A0AAV2Z3W8_9STRA|nr:TPA: hypothetical protein N0F65_002695 [Lagenidium giganteum]